MSERQSAVLKALDVAKTQLYHYIAIVITGMGFFTDAYDLFSITLVTNLISRIYYHGAMPPHVLASLISVALWGALAGQLFFGWLGDKMGRKKMYGLTLLLMVVCSINSGLSFGNKPKGVIATLCFFRFWLGFGIGGDYPLSATIMSEYANKHTRGAFIAAVFAMQGFGILASGIVSLTVSHFFSHKHKDHTLEIHPGYDYAWRIILMFGAVPAALTYYSRMMMPETPRYTVLIARNAKQAAADVSKYLNVKLETEAEAEEEEETAPHNQLNTQTQTSTQPNTPNPNPNPNQYGLFSKEFLKRHGLHLLGTTSTWFFLDIAFYSSNLFQKDIFTEIGWIRRGKEMNAIHEVHKIARAQTLIALCSTVPGYWFTVALIDYMGRFTIQLMGFFFMTVFMFALAIPYHHWTLKQNRIGFVVMYSITFFFSNFGPNATTFVLPAEIFPARLRSTCHGISAGAGKAGAIVGTFVFLYATQSNIDPGTGDPGGKRIRYSLIMLAVINFFGMLCTLMVPEPKGKSLEDVSEDNNQDQMLDGWVIVLRFLRDNYRGFCRRSKRGSEEEEKGKVRENCELKSEFTDT